MEVKVRIKGISPILMNPATEELLIILDGGASTRKLKDMESTPKEKAEEKIIRNDKGEIGIPQEYLTSCLIEAGRLLKIDSKRNISTKESTLLYTFLSIKEMFFPFLSQSPKWVVDRRKGVMDSGGKKVAVCITRPRFDEWSFDATFIIDEKMISVEKVIELVRIAGAAVGLGDFRPAKRGPFGRFKIDKWAKVSQ